MFESQESFDIRVERLVVDLQQNKENTLQRGC